MSAVRCLHHLFARRAAASPGTVAVVAGDRAATYGELDGWARGLAERLTIHGGAGEAIGLFSEPSIEMVVGMLGIVMAGSPYLPLDPSVPRSRLRLLCADAGVRLVVAARSSAGAWPGGAQEVLEVDLEPPRRPVVPASSLGGSPQDLAYVLYTSGSTGTPKGVEVEHRSVVALLDGFEAVAPAGPRLVGTCLCPFSFDVSVWEIFSVLCWGGTLHVLGPPVAGDANRLSAYLLDEAVTSAYLPPALIDPVTARLGAAPGRAALDRVLVGVEPIPQASLQRLRDVSPGLRIINGYGPTETTVCATFFPFGAASDPARRTPIGFPVAGYDVWLVDEDLKEVPEGEVGEILIGGAGLARGYRGDPVTTAAKFVDHPFSSDRGARVYRTGDLGRRLPNGAIEYVGRVDNQLKVRGFRVEPGEVEAALLRRSGVRHATVLADNGRRLVAFVESDGEISGIDLRRAVAADLPEHMVPARVVVVDALPVNANGKIDREALWETEPARPELDEQFVAPSADVEHRIATVWAEAIGVSRVGVNDDFFELGGDSLAAITIAATLSEELTLEVTVGDVFSFPTVAELAASIRVDRVPSPGPA